jgi:hypothetical protein
MLSVEGHDGYALFRPASQSPGTRITGLGHLTDEGDEESAMAAAVNSSMAGLPERVTAAVDRAHQRRAAHRCPDLLPRQATCRLGRAGGFTAR